MAEKGFTPIQSFPLFKNRSLSAGDSATSPAIDLRYNAQRGNFGIYASVTSGTAGTAGTTVFTYLLAPDLDGTYVAPSAAVAMGTFGTNALSDFKSATVIIGPFMKVVATQAGAGTVGKDTKIQDARLIVQ